MSLPLLGAGMATDGPSAVLDLNFASLLSLTPSVGPTPSYTRASTGTYFNSSGVLTTAAINGPRFDHVYNGVSWVSKGLLVEEQRVNYVKYANDLSTNWTNEASATREYNSIVSPDGGTNATKVNVAVSAYSGIYQYQNPFGGSGTYTYSIFAKKGTKDWLAILNADSGQFPTFFNISNGTIGTVFSGYSATILDVGNGWYRCIFTTASSATPTWFQILFVDANNSVTPASTGYSYVYGAQVELGAFPTSYIPTTTAAVTRSADVCQITGGDFSGFWNEPAGTLVAEGDTPASGTRSLVSADNATANESTILRTLATDPLFIVTDGGVAQASIDAGTVVSSTAFKLAASYTVNDFAVSKDGAAVVTDTSGTIPTPTQLNIGSDASGNYVTGHIARLRYYNTRLINSQLVELST